MGRPLNLEINESVEYLSKSLKKARTAVEKERLQMLWWIKTGQVTQHQQLSRILGRDGSTVTRWLQKYRQGGLRKLLEVKASPGAAPKMTLEMRCPSRGPAKLIALGGETAMSPRVQQLWGNPRVAKAGISCRSQI